MLKVWQKAAISSAKKIEQQKREAILRQNSPYEQNKRITQQELATFTNDELAQILQAIQANNKDLKKLLNPEYLTILTRWGLLSEKQAKHTSTHKVISSFTDAGLGGATIPISLTRILLTVLDITLKGTALYVTTIAIGSFALILGPLAFYSLYNASNKAERKSILTMQLANVQSLIYDELNNRLEEAYFETCFKAFEQLQTFNKTQYQHLIEEILFIGINWDALQQLINKQRSPGWLKEIKQNLTLTTKPYRMLNSYDVYWSQLQKVKQFVSDSKIIDKIYSSLNIHSKELVSEREASHYKFAGKEVFLKNLIKVITQSKAIREEKANQHLPWYKSLWKTIKKPSSTIPVLTAGGIALTTVGLGYLGGSTFYTLITTGSTAALTIGTGGAALACITAIGLGIFFGYRYYARMREMSLLQDQVSNAQKTVIEKEHQHIELQQQYHKVSRLQQAIDLVDEQERGLAELHQQLQRKDQKLHELTDAKVVKVKRKPDYTKSPLEVIDAEQRISNRTAEAAKQLDEQSTENKPTLHFLNRLQQTASALIQKGKGNDCETKPVLSKDLSVEGDDALTLVKSNQEALRC